MTRLEITDTFFIPKKGVVVTGDIAETGEIDETDTDAFPIDESVIIQRPDGTYFFSRIYGMEEFYTVSGQRKVGVLLGAEIAKEDIPHGSIMTVFNFQ